MDPTLPTEKQFDGLFELKSGQPLVQSALAPSYRMIFVLVQYHQKLERGVSPNSQTILSSF